MIILAGTAVQREHMNKLITASSFAVFLALACSGSNQPLETRQSAGGAGASIGTGGAAGAGMPADPASMCRLAPPCPSGWYQYSDTVCSPPSIGYGPGCSSSGDGLCYQPCESGATCTDPRFPNCTALSVFGGSDVGRPQDGCTSVAAVPACASNLGGATGGATGGTGAAPVASGGTGGAAIPEGTGPASTQLLATARAPWGLAVDATTVYVAAQVAGPLVAVPVAGGAPAQLATDSVFTVAIDESSVYWSNGTSILSCAKHACATSTVALAPSGPAHGIAVDATNVYWANTSGGEVMKVGKKGGASVALATGGYPYQIAVDDTNVYWTNQTPGAVMKVPTAGGAPVQLATCVGPMGIAVDASNVYFTSGDGKILQVPKGGGDPLTLSAELGNEPWGIATDGKNVYGASMDYGTIVKVPIGGGAATVLAWGQGDPAGVAVDATYVYWTAVESGKIMRVAK
jgi:hypothetical protein